MQGAQSLCLFVHGASVLNSSYQWQHFSFLPCTEAALPFLVAASVLVVFWPFFRAFARRNGLVQNYVMEGDYIIFLYFC
jgi:hypothetical protein